MIRRANHTERADQLGPEHDWQTTPEVEEWDPKHASQTKE